MPSVRVTSHAREQYCKRIGCFKPNDDIEKLDREILSLLRKAKKENPSPDMWVKRVIDNNFREATYYRLGGWRFVVCNDVLVTVERSYFVNRKVKIRNKGRCRTRYL